MTSTRCAHDAVTSSRKKEFYVVNNGFVPEGLVGEFRVRAWQSGWLTVALLSKITHDADRANKGIATSDSEIQIKEKRETEKHQILDAAMTTDPKRMQKRLEIEPATRAFRVKNHSSSDTSDHKATSYEVYSASME